MKKTLIALAAVAVSSAAMAQVTVSGKLRYAYESSETTTGSTVYKGNGIARTDGDVVFSFAEDLGNGLKASGNMAIQTGGRTISSANRDGNLMLGGGFGTIAFGSFDAGNGIIGLGGAGAPVWGNLEGPILTDSGNNDYVSYATPSISGITFRVIALEASNTTSAATGANTFAGLDSGTTAATQDAMVYAVNYAAGPLAFAADVTVHGNNAKTTTLGDGRTRISASYDLGVAKIGAGYETRDAKATLTGAAVNTKDTILGVSIPLGNLVLGANYATSKTAGEAFTVKGTEIGVRYNLSKRTYVAFQTQDVKNADIFGAKATTNKASRKRIQVAHSF
jgi:hypothetical protein